MTLKSMSPDSASISLEKLADFIWGNELWFGQATKIGNDGQLSVIVFDSSLHVPDAVDETTRVKVVIGNNPPPQGALSFLCQGKAIVADAETYVKVFRV